MPTTERPDTDTGAVLHRSVVQQEYLKLEILGNFSPITFVVTIRVFYTLPVCVAT